MLKVCSLDCQSKEHNNLDRGMKLTRGTEEDPTVISIQEHQQKEKQPLIELTDDHGDECWHSITEIPPVDLRGVAGHERADNDKSRSRCEGRQRAIAMQPARTSEGSTSSIVELKPTYEKMGEKKTATKNVKPAVKRHQEISTRCSTEAESTISKNALVTPVMPVRPPSEMPVEDSTYVVTGDMPIRLPMAMQKPSTQ